MNIQRLNDHFKNVVLEVDRLFVAIDNRGYDDINEDWDDYSHLFQSYEFRKLVTFEIYESYFTPRRHEFELRLLTQLVDAVASSRPVAFVAGAIMGGVLGNAVYDMLKLVLLHVIQKFKKIKRTHNAFQEIYDNLPKIRKYLDKHDKVQTTRMSTDLKIETHKLDPLLKLLGCRSRLIKKKRFWSKPESW